MIIDSHTHVFSPRIVSRRDEYINRDACFAALYGKPGATLATVQELLAGMDRDGINVSVIANIGWTSHELCVETNDYILECLVLYPKRLVGLAMVQPVAGEAALAELERCVQAGVRGLGEMRPDIQGFDLRNEKITGDIASYLAGHRLVWMSHASEPVGHPYSGKGTLTPGVLYPFIENQPELKIILAHWGGGLLFYGLMPEVREKLKNVYFDTAASPFLYDRAVYGQAIDIVGSDHVIFGSDFPLMPARRVIQEIAAAGLLRQASEAILGGNARALFNIV